MTTSAVDPPWVIEATGLRKSYRSGVGASAALDGLDLHVPRGGVHGFVGPNGSGKTTTIRILLGLVRPDAGTVRIFGHDVSRDLPEVVDRVGAIVEQPRFFPHFSAQKNLMVLARAIGVPRGRVGVVLDQVGLADRAKARYRTYSLGMKQRLAVAAALLKNPDLVIFDEPTNGLDPAGIHALRGLIRGLAAEGKTVVVSSHILAEVQQLAQTISIVGRGRLLAEGPVAEILARTELPWSRVVVAEPLRAAGVLHAAGYHVQTLPDDSLRVAAPHGYDPAGITRALAAEGLYVAELAPVTTALEDVFLSLTASSALGAPPIFPPRQPGDYPAAREALASGEPAQPADRPGAPPRSTAPNPSEGTGTKP